MFEFTPGHYAVTLPNYFRITYSKPINSGGTVEVILRTSGSIYFDVYNYCGASYECTIYEADFRLLSFDRLALQTLNPIFHTS